MQVCEFGGNVPNRERLKTVLGEPKQNGIIFETFFKTDFVFSSSCLDEEESIFRPQVRCDDGFLG